MYVELVSAYVYHLPCGADFRTQIKSVEHDEGHHFFPCRRCDIAHAIREEDLDFYPPPVVESMDEAIIKDRILSDLRSAWGSIAAQEIADRHGKHVNLVYKIGRQIGLWNNKE